MTQNGNRINKINEMEFIYGYLWANVFGDTKICKIDPNTGNILKVLELKPLATAELMYCKLNYTKRQL